MSGDVVALLLGAVLAVGALAFVLYPLFFETRDAIGPRPAEPLRYADDSAILALREIEFDRATGKLSESDYAELKRTYTKRALEEMRSAGDAGTPLDEIEARVRAIRMLHRECPSCGLRPEPDAIYCSTCGGFLPGACPACSAPIAEASAAFCSTCGVALSGAVGV